MSGSREIGVFPRVQIFIQSQFFLTYYACAPFNWVLSVTKKKLRIAEFFASLPFPTYICDKKQYTAFNTLRSIIEKNSTDTAGVE